MTDSSGYTVLEGLRFERKFMVERLSLPSLRARIGLHSAFFKEIYQGRYINNIYLDTPSLAFYQDNQRGVMNREKLRIRWYGELEGQVLKPVLEVKRKRGLIGTKDSYPLSSFSFNRALSSAKLHEVFAASDLPDIVRERIAGLRPTLVNRYSRQYFLDRSGRYRLTLDSELQYFGVLSQEVFPLRMHGEPGSVIELKYDSVHADNAARIPDEFPFRMTKNSKYVKGIELYFPNAEM